MADYPKFLDPRSAEALERSRNRVIDEDALTRACVGRAIVLDADANEDYRVIDEDELTRAWETLRAWAREDVGRCWRCGVEYAACLCHGHTHGRGAE